MPESPSNAPKDAAQSTSAPKDATQSTSAQNNATESQDDDTETTKIIQEPNEAKIDIVFVHGLIDKAAWTCDTGVFWPQSLLASKVPEARIMSFEYDSKKINPPFEVETQIGAISGLLLSELVDLRKGAYTRPIIFVAHCLGGVILEDAIVGASGSNRRGEKELVPSTRGILLLGTPHFKEESEQDAKKYFQYAGSPESSTFNEQLELLKSIHQKVLKLQKTGQAKFEIESFCAGRGNEVSKALVQWSETLQPRVLDRSQLQLSQYENEKNRDFKQVMRILTSWSEIVEEPQTGTAGPESGYHTTFDRSTNSGFQAGQTLHPISGLTFNTHNGSQFPGN